eukprot:5667421-Amphidinium_carterae.1
MAPPPAPQTPCCMCMKPSVRWCGGCRQYAYCGKDCQRLHWRTHKLDCGPDAKGNQGTDRSNDRGNETVSKRNLALRVTSGCSISNRACTKAGGTTVASQPGLEAREVPDLESTLAADESFNAARELVVQHREKVAESHTEA